MERVDPVFGNRKGYALPGEYHSGLTRRTFLLTPLALAAAGRKTNLLLVIARGWRGQATPWAGDPDLKAPTLESFTKDAIVFPRAYAAYPHPGPARAAIATGRYPHSISGDPPTLSSVLRAAGYRVEEQIGVQPDAAKLHDGPFCLTVRIEPSHPTYQPDPASLHPRQNVASDAMREQLAARYAAYWEMDLHFGRLLKGIDPSNTIVAFTSDAGEQIGSHNLDDDDTFYEESTRVPLAIRVPGVAASVSNLEVSHVDLMPTLLGLCGEPAPEDVQGHDLSRLLTGGAGERPESIFAEGRIGQRDEWRVLIVGFDKLVTNASGDALHLFNLATDPYEMKDLLREASDLKKDQLLATMRTVRSRLLDFRKR